MARLKDAEIAPVEGCDTRDVEAFGQRHYAAIHDVEFCVGIRVRYTAHSVQVVFDKGFELGIQTREVFEKSLYSVVAEVAPEQIAGLRQDYIGNNPQLGILIAKTRCLAMEGVLGVIKGNQEAAVDDKRHESMRLLR